MTKKNINPQQAAPVQRPSVTANSSTEGEVTPSLFHSSKHNPFAGDDAE